VLSNIQHVLKFTKIYFSQIINGVLIYSAVFVRRIMVTNSHRQTDRQTDRQTFDIS